MYSTGQTPGLEVSGWGGDVNELQQVIKEHAIQRPPPEPVVAPMANSWHPPGPNSRKRVYVLQPLGVWDRDGKLTTALGDAVADADIPTPSCSLVASTCDSLEQCESSVSAIGNNPNRARVASTTSITLAHVDPLSSPATPGRTPTPPAPLSSWSFAPAGGLRNPAPARTPFARISDPSLMYTGMESSVAPVTYPFLAPTSSCRRQPPGNQLLAQPQQPLKGTGAISHGVPSCPAGARFFHGVGGKSTTAGMFSNTATATGAGAGADVTVAEKAYLQMWQSCGPMDEDMALLPPMCTLTNGLDSLPEPAALSGTGSLEYRPSAWISSVSFAAEERGKKVECSRMGVGANTQGSRASW